MNYYKIKYNKYITKLQDINDVSYYFNSYGKPVPEKYYMLLNLIKIKKASEDDMINIRNNAIILAKDDYSARLKLTIGSYNTIITLLSKDSVLNFTLKENNTCYIETFCGFSTLLLNVLKELCDESNIHYIHTYSNYQPETSFLLENGFVQNKNKLLVYVL